MIQDNNNSLLIEYVAGKTFYVFIYNDIMLYLEENVLNQERDPDDIQADEYIINSCLLDTTAKVVNLVDEINYEIMIGSLLNQNHIGEQQENLTVNLTLIVRYVHKNFKNLYNN